MRVSKLLTSAVAESLDAFGPEETLKLLRIQMREVRKLTPAALLEHAEHDVSRVGKLVVDEMVPGWGFALVFFTWGSGPDGSPRMTYASNGEREAVSSVLIELGARMRTGKGRV